MTKFLMMLGLVIVFVIIATCALLGTGMVMDFIDSIFVLAIGLIRADPVMVMGGFVLLPLVYFTGVEIYVTFRH